MPFVATGGAVLGLALVVSRPGVVLCSLAVWLVFSAPGFCLLGRRAARGPSELALASVLGVAATLTVSAVTGCLVGRFSVALVLVVSGVLSLAAAAARRRWPFTAEAACGSPAWSLAGVWAVLVMIAVPYGLVGADVGTGFAYRPFFQADFFKHMGYTHSLLLGAMPPIDAFSLGGTLHYYWLGYVMPATVLALGGPAATAGEAVLLTGLWQTIVLALLLYAVALRLSRRPAAAAAATALGFLCLTPDGPTALLMRWAGRVPVGADLNPESVDALAVLTPFRLDVNSLHRLCLYLQQHQLALLFFLGWAYLATLPRGRDTRFVLPCKVLLLLPAVGTSLAVGVVSAVVIVSSEAVAARSERNRIQFAAVCAAVLAGAVFSMLAGMVGGEPPAEILAGAPDSDLTARLAHAFWLVPQLVSNLGGIVLLGSVGALVLLRDRRLPAAARAAAATGIGSAVAILLAVRLLPLPRARFEVDLKTSYVLGLCLVLGTSVTLARWTELWPRRRALLAGALALLVVGLPTPVLDVLWHADLAGEDTTVVPAGDMEALTWIRRNLPRDAVFQSYPYRHFVGIDVWVPIFAGRRIVASPRGTNSGEDLVESVKTLFDEPDPARLHRRAADLGIDYLYVHRTMGVDRFERMGRALREASDGFERVFSNDEAAVWRVVGERASDQRRLR